FAPFRDVAMGGAGPPVTPLRGSPAVIHIFLLRRKDNAALLLVLRKARKASLFLSEKRRCDTSSFGKNRILLFPAI
ncbi:MAG: hypothetical protein LBV54_03705, partial [Puniceicoccales bacterium]|nr:hypothetical protein [Puniceicoccales bacterium]